MENEIETSKKYRGSNLLQVKTKNKQKKQNFLSFLRFSCFFNRIRSWPWGQFFGSTVTLACLFEVFTGLWLSTSTFCIKSYDYVKHFVRVLVLLVKNTGCLKKFLKYGERYIVDFQFNLC